uniref:Uncharacterized protein n=1 Tax=Spongospora subterranea TaxID=70186 RepID=A0A0H5QQA2_9EUKA|eukprot:CRZ04260.1 hypothetical protein [Spongospora subterranea]
MPTICVGSAQLDWDIPRFLLSFRCDKNILTHSNGNRSNLSAFRPGLVLLTDYTPWTNCTVQDVKRHIWFLMKSLLSGLGLPFQEWPSLIPLENVVISQNVCPGVGFAPINIFTGLEVTNFMGSIFISRPDQVFENSNHAGAFSDTYHVLG